MTQARAPAHLLEGSWPTEALLAQIAVAKHSEHMPLNRQAVVMARHGVPIDRSVLADWMGRTGALIAPVVERMAVLLKTGSSRLYVDETTAPVLDPGRGRTKTGYLWAVLRDDRGWNGPAPPGVTFHYHPGRSGAHAEEILAGFDGTIQVDAYGGYDRLARNARTGGAPLKLAFCWSHGRRKLIAAKPKAGSPIVDEALRRIAALYRIEDETPHTLWVTGIRNFSTTSIAGRPPLELGGRPAAFSRIGRKRSNSTVAFSVSSGSPPAESPQADPRRSKIPPASPSPPPPRRSQ